jgi:hypothetical protein
MGAYRGTATVIDNAGKKHAIYALLTSSTDPAASASSWNGKLTGGTIAEDGAQITIQLPSGREGTAQVTGRHGRDAALTIEIAGSGPPPFD